MSNVIEVLTNMDTLTQSTVPGGTPSATSVVQSEEPGGDDE
jgi:hypothetical protein